MDRIERTRQKARRIPSVTPQYISPALLNRMSCNREEILAGEDEVRIQDYLDRATDEEVLCLFSEMSLRQPLNQDGYLLYMHLAAKVFSSMGVDVPDGKLDDGKENLGSFHTGLRRVFGGIFGRPSREAASGISTPCSFFPDGGQRGACPCAAQKKTGKA